MMVLQRIILLAIFACFTVYGDVSELSRRHITRDKYLGHWYVPAAIAKDEFGATIRCFTFDVTEGNKGEESFEETLFSISVLPNGEVENKAKRYGKITNSVIHVDAAEGAASSNFMSFNINNGQQFVIHSKENGFNSILLSKTPTVPAEIMDQFKNFAALFKGHVQIFATNNCEKPKVRRKRCATNFFKKIYS